MIEPVVDLSWLQEHRLEVILADVRWYLDGRSGRAAYNQGHLPGAIFVDLDHHLAGSASPEAGRHPLPDPKVFAERMSQLGITNEDPVVAYDDAGGVIAARLVWMLRALGQDAALLNGGLQAYSQPLEIASKVPAPAVFEPRPWPQDRLANIDEAANRANLVIDARDRARYEGTQESIDPRPGHIPGARSLPCKENLATDGTFLSAVELRERFIGAGITDASDVISSCGSGVTACHNLVALEFAGLGKGRLYPGSWSQYSQDPTRVAALGPLP